ncbi:MAG: GNAT family N-acetyltransferase [Firmicutes bacterium]|nr:GNAT family N-acetyltransferase [Bacillota bacterium]
MIVPMTAAYARQISGWTYTDEYAMYSFAQTGETVRELLGGEYYAQIDGPGDLRGFFCFGLSARIPATGKDPYASGALDMGLGMRPDLCGQGHGYAFVLDGLAFARQTFAIDTLRLSVAAGNLRAVRTYAKAGFRHEASVTHRRTRQLFYIMVCPCGQRSAQ